MQILLNDDIITDCSCNLTMRVLEQFGWTYKVSFNEICFAYLSKFLHTIFIKLTLQGHINRKDKEILSTGRNCKVFVIQQLQYHGNDWANEIGKEQFSKGGILLVNIELIYWFPIFVKTLLDPKNT